MARFMFAVLFVAGALSFSSPVVAQEEPEQPSASGGLGNTRSDLDRVYGEVERTNVTDVGDYASDAVS